MSIYVSNGPYVNQLINVTTGKLVSDFIKANCVTCGWTILSDSGAGDIVVKSAVTPGGNYACFRFRGGADANFYATMRNAAGDKAGGEKPVILTSRDVRVIIQPFSIWLLAIGQSSADYNFMGGTLILPSFLGNQWTNEYSWACGAHTGNNTSFRNSLQTSGSACNGLAGGTLMDNSGSQSNSPGSLSLVVPRCEDGNDAGLWTDAITLDVADPIVAWGDTYTSVKRKRGQMPDAAVLTNASLPADTVATFMGHTWYPVTAPSSDTSGLWVLVG